ncbi:hypothetical protein [Streptosporangium sandarakinum]|uniref:hypothetical protein n=1 Tax=Streptosporangium sandarakinum TaxID=1260955 RepID=UPI0033BEFACC
MNASEVFLAIVLGIVVNEMCDLSPWLAVRLVALAARLQHGTSPRAEERSEDFAAYINDRPGKLFKLLTALGFLATGAVTGLRRRQRSLSLAVRWRVNEGLLAIMLGGLVSGADPTFWPNPTMWSVIGGIVLGLSGLFQVVAAYANRPWYVTANGIGLLASSVGFALGAVGSAIAIDAVPASVVEIVMTVFLSAGALLTFTSGLRHIRRPRDIPEFGLGS